MLVYTRDYEIIQTGIQTISGMSRKRSQVIQDYHIVRNNTSKHIIASLS